MLLRVCGDKTDEHGNRKRDNKLIDTSTIPFIAMGAFSDMDYSVKRTNGDKRIGFRATEESVPDNENLIAKIEKYGFLTEFLGRFSQFVVLNSLSVNALKRIMLEGEDSLIKKTTEKFLTEGINLIVDESAIDAIARSAYQSGLGARNLTVQLESILKDVEFEMFVSGREATVVIESDDKGALRTRIVKNASRRVRKQS